MLDTQLVSKISNTGTSLSVSLEAPLQCLLQWPYKWMSRSLNKTYRLTDIASGSGLSWTCFSRSKSKYMGYVLSFFLHFWVLPCYPGNRGNSKTKLMRLYCTNQEFLEAVNEFTTDYSISTSFPCPTTSLDFSNITQCLSHSFQWWPGT